jgi:hypothetical protein
MAREETLYELVNIASGISTPLISTNDKKVARNAYQKQFRASGTTPRVFVNGVKLTIAEGDKLFIDANEASPWRGNKPTGAAAKNAPKYTNKQAKIAEEKTRTSQRQPRGGGQV